MESSAAAVKASAGLSGQEPTVLGSVCRLPPRARSCFGFVALSDGRDVEPVADVDPYIEFNSEVSALKLALYEQRCQASELVE